jgi:hypothetical protein
VARYVLRRFSYLRTKFSINFTDGPCEKPQFFSIIKGAPFDLAFLNNRGFKYVSNRFM